MKKKTLEQLGNELEEKLKKSDFNINFRTFNEHDTKYFRDWNVAEDGLPKRLIEPEEWN